MGAMKRNVGWLVVWAIVGLSFAVPAARAADSSSWQAVPAYGTELEAIKDWQEAAIEKPAQDEDVSWFAGGDGGSVAPLAVNVETPILKTATLEKTSVQTIKAELAQKNANLKNKKSSPVVNTTTAGKTAVTTPAVSSLSSSGNTANNSAAGGTFGMFSGLMGNGGLGGLGGLTGGTGGIGNMLGGGIGGGSGNSISADELQKQIDTGTVSVNMFGQQYDDARELSADWKAIILLSTMSPDNSAYGGINAPYVPTSDSNPQGTMIGISITANFDPCKPGRETKFYSPLVIDTDRSGAIALDGGTIQFDIAPHIAGLETIPVPAPGKDMFLVWDKAGTETIEGAEREYKEGEIVDITELFGPTDYTRSDFSVLAYTDDGFTKLRKLCDVDNDGDVDKADTALSAEVSAKLKLWSPLSGELVLFKDTGIVIDIRAGSYERHPSDVEGWTVEYKMKDAQGRLLGYQWLSSKTSTPLCVDVLLAVQGE